MEFCIFFHVFSFDVVIWQHEEQPLSMCVCVYVHIYLSCYINSLWVCMRIKRYIKGEWVWSYEYNNVSGRGTNCQISSVIFVYLTTSELRIPHYNFKGQSPPNINGVQIREVPL